jgi:hypothetical protein
MLWKGYRLGRDKIQGDIENSYSDPKKAKNFLNFEAKDKLEHGPHNMLKP